VAGASVENRRKVQVAGASVGNKCKCRKQKAGACVGNRKHSQGFECVCCVCV
jgi:hypothetical protein